MSRPNGSRPHSLGGARQITGPAAKPDFGPAAFDPSQQVQPEMIAVTPIVSTGAQGSPDGTVIFLLNMSSATGLVRSSAQLTYAGVRELIGRLEELADAHIPAGG